MAKFNLGKVPTNFKREVLIDMFDGSQDAIEMIFKYRTRTQYAQLIDDIIAGGNTTAKGKKSAANVDGDADKNLTLQSMLAEQDDLSVNFVLQIADGWDLTDFGKPALKEMKDKFPGAIEAIIEAYRVSILEGRLKN